MVYIRSMKTLLITTPQAKIGGKAVRQPVPKLRGWQIEARPSSSLGQTATIPDVTLVQLDNETRPADLQATIRELVHIQARALKRSYVLFSVKENMSAGLRGVRPNKFNFRAMITQVNYGLRAFPYPDCVG